MTRRIALCLAVVTAYPTAAADIDLLFGGCGGVYFLAEPGELVIELEKRYSIMSLITDAGFWWALLALLIVVVWLLKKRRAREIERRWRIEDRIQGEPNFNEYVDPDDDESWRG